MKWIRRTIWISFGIPLFSFAKAAEFDTDNATALLSCLPRTFRALRWASAAGWDYYSHQHSSTNPDWSNVHSKWLLL